MQAKLTTPHTVDAVVSPELLRRFESCAQRRLTLVSAPAGYGKTTITVAALRALRLAHIWYRADVLDHDPAVTILSLCEALRGRRPGFGELLRERLLHPSEAPLSVEGMAAAFVVAAQEDAPAELHLVIDDYHEATGSDEFNRMLDYLIDNLPGGWRLIVLGRYEPGFETARLRLADRLGFIGADDLRLDPTRVHDLLRRHVPEADFSQASRLAELTGGWPAAVSLAAEAISRHDAIAAEEALADPRLTSDIYAYLAEQVYRRERAELRTFLKRTCDLDSFTPEIAGRVAEDPDAHQHLTHLARNRIFTFRAEGTGSYRYHPLFRDYLRETCLLEDGPDACRQRRLDTAAALEHCGEIERSVELLIAASEPELALDVVARQGEAAFGRHRAETLDAWLARLPAALVESHPWAQLLSAHRETRDGRYDQALRHIDAAARVFRSLGDGHGLYSALSAKERALFWRGDPQAALAACREALSVAESDAEKLHTYASMLSAAVDMGDWKAAEAARRAGATLSSAGVPEEPVRMRALHSSALCARGQFRAAHRESHRVNVNALSPFSRPELLASRATIAYSLAEYEEAIGQAAAALRAARQVGHDVLVGYARDTLGFAQVLFHGTDTGLHELTRAREELTSFGDLVAAAWPTMHIGTYERRHGCFDAAVSAYRDAVQMTAANRDSLARQNARVDLAFAVGLGGGRTSVQMLRELEIEAVAMSLDFVRLKAAFFGACLNVHGNREEAGLSVLGATVVEQLKLGHLSFVGRELLTQWDVARELLGSLNVENALAAIMDALARHEDSRPALAAAATLGEAHALAVLRAADRWYTQNDRTMVARAVLRTRFRRARARAAEMLTPSLSSPDDRVRLAYDLTQRETQVLRLISEGLSNQDIEATLHVSRGTVKTHVNHLFRKLEVTDRVAAVLRYKEAAARGE